MSRSLSVTLTAGSDTHRDADDEEGAAPSEAELVEYMRDGGGADDSAMIDTEDEDSADRHDKATDEDVAGATREHEDADREANEDALLPLTSALTRTGEAEAEAVVMFVTTDERLSRLTVEPDADKG